MKKVGEKSGNNTNFQKSCYSQHASGNFIFNKLQAILEKKVSEHKLQAIYVQKPSFSNIYGLRFYFKD